MKKIIVLLMTSVIIFGSSSMCFAADKDVPKIFVVPNTPTTTITDK